MATERKRRAVTVRAGDHSTVQDLTTAAQAASGLVPGFVLNDHYRIVREIARGGMGVVFEAEDVKLAGRRLAVKVLPPEMAGDEAAVMRLQREAAAVCLLDHPSIVRLVELNADGPCHYLVMEYLDGDNLAVHLARHERLALDEVLSIARQVGGALAFAHRQNVVHRDVKPANLMFTTVGGERVAKITDFGIAFQIKDAMTRLTGQESAGTLLYAAPEQLKGMRPSAASDQYSFAATLYELLAGHPPFAGPALAHQVMTATPQSVEGVPDGVNSALRRALAKEPEERFPDVAAFVAALEAGAAATGGAAPAGAPPGRRRLSWPLVLLMLLLLPVVAFGLANLAALVYGAAAGLGLFEASEVTQDDIDREGGLAMELRVGGDDDSGRSRGVAATAEVLRRRLQLYGVDRFSVEELGRGRLGVRVVGPTASRETLRSLMTYRDLLTFKAVRDNGQSADELALRSRETVNDEVLPGVSPPGGGPASWYLVKREPEMGGEALARATVAVGQFTGEPEVCLEFTKAGAERFMLVTEAMVGKQLAIVLVGRVYSAPVIREAIGGGQARISGAFDLVEAERLVAVLGAGALPEPVTVVGVREVASASER